MSSLSRLKVAFKALRQLGPIQTGLYAIYQLGLRTGYYKRTLVSSLNRLEKSEQNIHIPVNPCLDNLPDHHALLLRLGFHVDKFFDEADEIAQGKVRLFAGSPVPLVLAPPKPVTSWTAYEMSNGRVNDQDIKFIWEVGRLGWACKLAMAYHLSKDERYAETTWQNIEQFLAFNPPYQGPQWSSAQEAAIRLIALSFVSQVLFHSSQTTPSRQEIIKKTIAIHAERIVPTLVYARSQNNNHLVTEALGLYTASAVLSGHPLAARWHKLGWKWLNHAFRTQISQDGTYTQHSTNYHRLMLQCALWGFAIQQSNFKAEPFPPDVTTRLQVATSWIWKQVDPTTGRVPNLGHNDGAYFLPLTVCPYEDYRPVVYAAAQAFLKIKLVPRGPWEDMADWLSLPIGQPENEKEWDSWQHAQPNLDESPQSPYILVNHRNNSWASLRIAQFHSRPAHADQLHLDLWWKGQNIAIDPGTYLYNAPPPWENSLTNTQVHNTLTVDGLESMPRVGRFLYLDWVQTTLLTSRPARGGGWESLSAQHNGYRNIGIVHSRMVTTFPDGRWEIIDLLDGAPGTLHTARMHWLLPDWEYEVIDHTDGRTTPSYGVRIHSPHGWIGLCLSSPSGRWKDFASEFSFTLVRAGEVLHGRRSVSPITGWTSPTYGDKIPALACIVEVNQSLPIDLKSEWTFPRES